MIYTLYEYKGSMIENTCRYGLYDGTRVNYFDMWDISKFPRDYTTSRWFEVTADDLIEFSFVPILTGSKTTINKYLKKQLIIYELEK